MSLVGIALLSAAIVWVRFRLGHEFKEYRREIESRTAAMERLGENLGREASYIHDLFVKQQEKVMEIEKRLEAKIDELKEAKELKSRNLTNAAIEELLGRSR